MSYSELQDQIDAKQARLDELESILKAYVRQGSPEIRNGRSLTTYICLLCGEVRPPMFVRGGKTPRPEAKAVDWHAATCPYRRAVEALA